MLTGSNGYLQPEYLKPLPTTLDAKNSPLALLAKTCSNIGKDESAKSIIPPIEKSDKRDASKSVSPSNRKSPLSDRERMKSSDALTSERFKLEAQDLHSSRRAEGMSSPRKEYSPRERDGSSPRSPLSSHKLDIKGSSDSKISLNCGSLSLDITHKENHGTAASARRSATPPSTSASSYAHPLASSASKLASLPHHHASLLSAYYPHLTMPGYPAYAGLHPALSAEAAALMAAQRQKSEVSAPHIATSYNPVKTVSGATTLVPVCSDPYCVSCKLAMQSAQLAAPSCGAGCTQCPRGGDKSALHGLSHSLNSGYPSALALGGLHSLSSLYGHHPHHPHHASAASASLSGHSSLPYVCSWVSGASYCGEKFATSEELMSHLRTHTTALEQSALHSGLSAAAAAYSPLALAGLSHLYPGIPSSAASLSPNSLSRSSYPHSLSPTSLLAASRYHPYMKAAGALSGLPTSLPSSALPSVHPSSLASAYPSLYPSLHGARFGSALVP